jgi:hypothetical protein
MSINPESPIVRLADPKAGSAMNLPDTKPLYRHLHMSPGQTPQEKAREAATSYVASAFLMPILGYLHESPFELKPPFAPGVGEKRFSTMVDQHMADRIAKASNFGLVETIVKRYASGSPTSATIEPLNSGKEFVDVCV